MIDASPGIPPHIALLLNEKFEFSDHRSAARKLKGMLRELKDQAVVEDILSKKPNESDERNFNAILSGGLNLFAGEGACQALPCRVSYATQISRSIALMADTVTASDSIFEKIMRLRSRPRNDEIYPLLSDLIVLKTIYPLIEAGLFKLSPPFIGACSGCMKSFNEKIEEITDRAFLQLGKEIKVERSSNGTSMDFASVYTPAIHIYIDEEFAKSNRDDEIIRSVLRSSIRSIFLDAKSASWLKGSVFSNSNAGITALLSEDGRVLDSWDLRAFSADRAANLPWVSGLTVRQTLELRNEAKSALPALREFMARRLSSPDNSQQATNWADTVAELRDQAAQVRSELAIATSRSRSLQRNAIGILGLCVSAVCLATEGPGSAIGGLLGTLGLVHSDSSPISEAKAKPGYVLVAAEDILHHAS
ncbi:hypothetical protein [Stenotrophomonas sepilia]